MSSPLRGLDGSLLDSLNLSFISDMHQSMNRLLRVIHTSSCRGLATRARPNSEGSGSKLPSRTRERFKYSKGSNNLPRVAPIGAAFVLGGAAFWLKGKKEEEVLDSNPSSGEIKIISLDELKEMCEKGRIVVAFQGALYDMSNFSGAFSMVEP